MKSRCTNIPHTGALLTVKGVGQRLRKGFQLLGKTVAGETGLAGHPMQVRILSIFESLSSAAKIRHSARNTRL